MTKRPGRSKTAAQSKKAPAHTIDIATPTAAWLRALPRATAVARRAALAALDGERTAFELSIVRVYPDRAWLDAAAAKASKSS